MAEPTYPLINGIRASWSDIEFRLRGIRNIGVIEINYSSTQDAQHVYGAGVKPIGRTRGQVRPEASFTMLKEEFNLLIKSLGNGYGEIPFDIVVQYRLDGLGVGTVNTDTIVGARIVGSEQGVSQGSDALSVRVSLSVMDVKINGLSITAKPI